MHVCMHAQSRPALCDPWTIASQALLSMEFFRQEYWSGLPFPSPLDLPNLGIEFSSPALADGFFTTTTTTWEACARLWKVKVLVVQSCLTLCDPMDCSLPGSVHGIFQARILEWVTMPFSRGSSQPRDWTWDPLHCRWILYHLSHQGSWL